MDHMDDAGPAVAPFPVTAIDHLIETKHGGLGSALAMPVDHRPRQKFDFGLVGRHFSLR
jgi:hypothetical protein